MYSSIISGQLDVAELSREDWVQIGDLVTTYADMRLGGTDASVMALAERYTPAFTLLPAPVRSRRY